MERDRIRASVFYGMSPGGPGGRRTEGALQEWWESACRIWLPGNLILSILPLMNGHRRKWLGTLAVTVLTVAVQAQDPIRNIVTLGYGDMAAIKQKAQAGDAAAQFALANGLASNSQSREALEWYRKAAEQGHVEATFKVGECLLFGAWGIGDQGVRANPTEGIRWTFRAATNHHAKACRNMARALREGIGVNSDPIEAYAWQQLSAEFGGPISRFELNQSALKMDLPSIQTAQGIANQLKAGGWRLPSVRIFPENDTRLKLNGITIGPKSSLAIINGKTLGEGESATIQLKDVTFKLTCLKIEKDSVQVAIEGEDAPRQLRLK